MNEKKLQKELRAIQKELDAARPQNALTLCENRLKKSPHHPLFTNIKSECLAKLGRFDEAIIIIQKQLKHNPSDHGNWNNLAITCRMAQKLEMAIEAEKKALVLSPNNIGYIFMLGSLYDEARDFDQALVYFREAKKLAPQEHRIQFITAQTLMKMSRLLDAVEALKKIPANLSVHFLFLDIYTKLNWYEEGKFQLEQIRKKMSNTTHHLMIYINGLIGLGMLDKAKEVMKTVPFVAEPHYIQSLLWCGGCDLQLLAKVESALINMPLNDLSRKNLYSSLSENYQKIDKLKAKKYLDAANEINHTKLIPHNIDFVEEFTSIQQSFASVPKQTVINNTSKPIFIIGMPRSGTTLVESIISSHSQVAAAGEAPYFSRLMNSINRPYFEQKDREETVYGCMSLVPKWNSQNFETLSNQYMEMLNQHSPDALKITDKFLHNFLYVGLIAKIFPNATIVHCMRHPVANCMSLYRKNLRPHHHYASDFKSMIQYYNLYKELMNYWKENVPNLNMLEVAYEDVVMNIEPKTHEILDFCGLPFEQACLDFHSNKRIVSTMSNTQVRSDLYTSSLKPWIGYESDFAELIEAFGI
ncbi:MAG: hypothetical protein COW84_03515 [Gammaproteobacteria bacterium CG22_combo_CG10-13_8_21_14_all_40_8]|nr:MAG: hypothetical protein COW84_03515 [Gammaproteobacteria bacterium CG22_combo_CG10-13_8_21_14_all_40_8]